MSQGVTPEAADLLRAARNRIATPERWAQGSFATVDGQKIGTSAIWNPAACLCVNGAVLAVRSQDGHRITGAGLCLSLAARARGYETASKFNDAASTTHADVLALLDEAIALAVSLAGVPS